MRKYSVALILLLVGCTKNPNEPEKQPDSPYTNQGNPALVIVVESKETVSEELELGFQLFHAQVMDILAAAFAVDEKKLRDLSLRQIMDNYGEEWQISELKRLAVPRFQKVIALTDQAATGQTVIDSLTALSKSGYDIDMIFTLHGSSQSVVFYEKSWRIDDFLARLRENGVVIRALYQTCCYGSDMIDNWQQAGAQAVSGAVGSNSFGIFSPIFFLEQWLSGLTFEAAVQAAYELEFQQLYSYRAQLPVMQYLLTDDMKAESRQQAGGLDKELLWEEFLVRE